MTEHPNELIFKETSITGFLSCHIVQDWNVWDCGVWKKDEIELILLKCLKWLKAGLHFLRNICLSFQDETYIQAG